MNVQMCALRVAQHSLVPRVAHLERKDLGIQSGVPAHELNLTQICS